ncbi:MAG: phytanoyl-CoA dioxygenase family protein [Fimbriimonadaceae bacterium]
MSPVPPLPELDEPFVLAPELIDAYRRDGWVTVRGLCSEDEIRAYRDAVFDAAMRHNRETRPLEERDTYGKAFLQVMNLWRVDTRVRSFVLAKRFAHVAAQLMGAAGVRLYHDQALFKEPGGGHTPWHQDQFYWPLRTDASLTMWMPMVDVDETMGSMSFACGSHRDGWVPIDDQISDTSEAFFDQYVASKGFQLGSAGAMRAGDATFHNGWTLHRAPGNVTDRVREVMTIIYYPDGTRIAEPRNEFQKADHEAWLGGLPVGGPADSPLNPRLWP